MQCDKCDGIAVFTRKYSGQSLCSKCFTNSIARKTAKTISKYKMINNNDLVAVAVSGGKDSLVLLHILNQMSKSHNFKIKVITIDEGIPGYRDEALDIVKDYCDTLGVEYNIFSYKDLFETTLEEALKIRENDQKRMSLSLSSCSICGTLRRRAIDYAADVIGANVIATAHNLDDNLQTYLINMLSGDTTKIGWMVPDPKKGDNDNNIKKIKPFSEIYESEIVFYAFTNDIPFQIEPCPHMSEGIRTEIREFLNSLEKQHAGIKNNLSNSVAKISGIMRKEAEAKIKRKCSCCGAYCTGLICSVCDITSKVNKG